VLFVCSLACAWMQGMQLVPAMTTAPCSLQITSIAELVAALLTAPCVFVAACASAATLPTSPLRWWTTGQARLQARVLLTLRRPASSSSRTLPRALTTRAAAARASARALGGGAAGGAAGQGEAGDSRSKEGTLVCMTCCCYRRPEHGWEVRGAMIPIVVRFGQQPAP
jgi:hypothetical protein